MQKKKVNKKFTKKYFDCKSILDAKKKVNKKFTKKYFDCKSILDAKKFSKHIIILIYPLRLQ
jgi:hypothetical protein